MLNLFVLGTFIVKLKQTKPKNTEKSWFNTDTAMHNRDHIIYFFDHYTFLLFSLYSHYTFSLLACFFLNYAHKEHNSLIIPITEQQVIGTRTKICVKHPLQVEMMSISKLSRQQKVIMWLTLKRSNELYNSLVALPRPLPHPRSVWRHLYMQSQCNHQESCDAASSLPPLKKHYLLEITSHELCKKSIN